MPSKKEIILDIYLHPRAKIRKALLGPRGLEIYVHSHPEKNKANSELISGIASALRIPKSGIQLIKGQTSRKKKILIQLIGNEAWNLQSESKNVDSKAQAIEKIIIDF
jgi:uncharacterized protein YggU (UPF0235/DUF167 family)